MIVTQTLPMGPFGRARGSLLRGVSEGIDNHSTKGDPRRSESRNSPLGYSNREFE